MLKGVLIIAAVVGIAASPTVIKQKLFHTTKVSSTKTPAKVTAKVEELLPIPGDSSYGQNCTFKGIVNGNDIWDCYPNGKNEDPNEVLAGIAIDQLPAVVVESWMKPKD